MKTLNTGVVLTFLAIANIHAQNTRPMFVGGQTSTVPVRDSLCEVVQSNANSRVWQRVAYEVKPSGEMTPRIHHYTELATGMYFQRNGQWFESKEEIDILPTGGAAATQGRHQVYFPADIYEGQIEVVTPDDLHLHSQPMGISYDDGSNIVLIAQLKDAVGELIGSNQVIYPNAFTDFKADLVCTYRRSGFESDVIFREQPPGPERYGLNPRTTRLQLLTEFLDTPEPEQATLTNNSTGLTDSTLRFGKMTMGRGKAFALADANSAKGSMPTRPVSNPVFKTWLHLDGRSFLVEQLPYRKIRPALQGLPVPTSASIATLSSGSPLHRVSMSRLLVPSRVAQKGNVKKLLVAKADAEDKKGVVLDYVETDGDEVGDFNFAAGTTYFINGDFIIDGTATFEGGAVIKYSNAGLIEAVGGPPSIVWSNDVYNLTIFTSMDDDSVGDTISGSSGVPAGIGNDYFLWLGDGTAMNSRFSYANTAVASVTDDTISNCQFTKCGTAIDTEDLSDTAVLNLHNVLFSQCANAIYNSEGDPWDALANNITVDQCTNFTTGGNIFATNSIFANTPKDANSTLAGLDNGFYNSGEFGSSAHTNTVSPFQAWAGGSYYLSSGCSFIDAGNVTADTVGFYQYTTQTNQTKEADSTVDLGYHYLALNSSNLPIDTNGDGIPDYIEDANGNGIWDVGSEASDWKSTSADTSGVLHFEVYTPLQ